MPLDPRRVAGGTLWARAESVTHDAKRIYGAALPRTWVRGTVIGCSSELKNAQAKRAMLEGWGSTHYLLLHGSNRQ
jgi:hypothetical protein